MTIRAVLFDMDGVLIDARDWHYEALNDALRLFGHEISAVEHDAVYDGLPTRKKLEILSRTRGFPTRLHAFVNELKQARTLELTQERCRPQFQHQYALSRLRQEGVKLGVCSNSVRRTVEVMMDKSHLAGYLDVVLSNEDVEAPKPDPEIYRVAMERLAVTPAECLIVEDNDHGLEAARASGAHVLAVASPADVTYDRVLMAMKGAGQ